MKNKLILIILYAFFTVETKAQGDALIVGKIDNPLSMEVTLTFNKDPFGFEKENYEAAIDDNNTFAVRLKMPEPRTVLLNYRNESIKLYLQPNDTLKLRFQGDYFTETLQFEGNAAGNNTFLFENRRHFYNPKEDTLFEAARKKYIHTDYITYVDSLFKIKKQTIEEADKSKLSDAFLRYIENDLAFGRAYRVMQYNRNGKFPVNAQWELRELPFDQPDILQNEYAHKVIENYVKYHREHFPDRFPHADTSVYQELKSAAIKVIKPFFDRLRVFENPILNENIIYALSKEEEALYLYDRTTERQKLFVNNVEVNDNFLKIKLWNGNIGWVENTKVYFADKRVDEWKTLPYYCLNTTSPTCDFDKFFTGKIYFNILLREFLLSMPKWDDATIEANVSRYLEMNRNYPEYNDLLRGAFKRHTEDKENRLSRINVPVDMTAEAFSLSDKSYEEFANPSYKKPKPTAIPTYVNSKSGVTSQIFIQPSASDSMIYLNEDSPLLQYEPSDKPFIFKGLALNELVPPFKLEDIAGHEVSLQNLLGKILFIDFWATHCSPCMTQIPLTQRLLEQYKNQNVAFLYISVDDNKTLWRQFLKEKKWQGIHANDAAIIPLNFNIQGLPYTLIIDKNGRVAYNSLLNSKITAEQMLETLLKMK